MEQTLESTSRGNVNNATPAPPPSSLSPVPLVPLRSISPSSEKIHELSTQPTEDKEVSRPKLTLSHSVEIPTIAISDEALNIIENLKEISRISETTHKDVASSEVDEEKKEKSDPELPRYWQLFLAKARWDKPPSPPEKKPSLKDSKKGNEEKIVYLAQKRYLLIDKLGKGGFGFIYSGVDLETGEEVAIKLV